MPIWDLEERREWRGGKLDPAWHVIEHLRYVPPPSLSMMGDWRIKDTEQEEEEKKPSGNGGGGNGGGGNKGGGNLPIGNAIPPWWYVAPPSEFEQWAYGQAWDIAQNPYYYLFLGQPAGYYSDILAGVYSPFSEAFRRSVYEATKEGAMLNLEDMQIEMARKFAQRGGYFGGQHALAQAELGRRTATDLNQILSQLMLEGWKEDIANRFTASAGMQQVIPLMRSMEWDDISKMLEVGGRERGIYTQALQSIYQDWLRAQQEQMAPLELALALSGMQTREPIIQQQQPSAWSYLFGGLSQGLGYALPYLLKLIFGIF